MGYSCWAIRLFVLYCLCWNPGGALAAEIALQVFDIRDYGAVGDGKTLCTGAIQSAVEACATNGGGKVVVPPGIFLSGAIFLRSDVHMEVQSGATLRASDDFNVFPPIEGRWEGIERKVYSSLLNGSDLENVALTGAGTLDGQGRTWWESFQVTENIKKYLGVRGRMASNPRSAPLRWPRPRMVNLYRCSNVLIRDLTFVNSPAWTVHPVYCENIMIDNIKIVQPYNAPNTDGIVADSCKNVRIVNCYIDCGDDCIAIKSGYNEDGRRVNIPSENIVISNCNFGRGRSAISIGSETSGGIRNIVVSNCSLKNTLRGLRIKTARGRGNVVENIRFTNITMDSVGTGISLDMSYGKRFQDQIPFGIGTPRVKSIRFSQVSGINLQKAAEIRGLPESPLRDVRFYDVFLSSTSGVEVYNAQDIGFSEIDLHVKEGSAVALSFSRQVELRSVRIKGSANAKPAFVFESVQHAYLVECMPVEKANILLELVGVDNRCIQIVADLKPFTESGIMLTDGATESAFSCP